MKIENEIIIERVRNILEHPSDHSWQVQGLGMLRTSLTPELRLHIWDKGSKFCADSGWHTHPWDFTSLNVVGRLYNTRYRIGEEGGGEIFNRQLITCGLGGCHRGEPDVVQLIEQPEELYVPGESYFQRKDEIHSTGYTDGTITLIRKKYYEDRDSAYVFYPVGSQWTSAEARPAEPAEIKRITEMGLSTMASDPLLSSSGTDFQLEKRT